MNIHAIYLTLFFEDPFWVGIFERTDHNGYAVSRVVFGTEPSNIELYQFLSTNFYRLRFSSPSEHEEKPKVLKSINPKRRQREAQKALNKQRTATKAQEAIKQMQEQQKVERKTDSKLNREEEKLKKFILKQNKKKEKHRGH